MSEWQPCHPPFNLKLLWKEPLTWWGLSIPIHWNTSLHTLAAFGRLCTLTHSSGSRMFTVYICTFKMLTWPLHSLDLSLVEHVYDILDKHVPTTENQIRTPPRLEGSTVTILMLLDHTARLQRFCRLLVANVVPNDDWKVSCTGRSEAFSYSS